MATLANTPITWKTQLVPGSFRGVAFYIDRHEFTGGRRVIDHIFPYRDMAVTENLGRRQRVFNVDVYVLGENYFGARDRLITALESDGPGIFSHPYLGTKNVEAVNFTVTESKAEGGIAYFSITFHETETQPTIPALDDIPKEASFLKDKVNQSLLEEFLAFDTSGINNFNLDILIDKVNLGTDVLEKAMKFIPDGDLGVSDLEFAIRTFGQTAKDLVLKPFVLAGSIMSSVESLFKMSLGDFRITETDIDRALRRDIPRRELIDENQRRRDVLQSIFKNYPKTELTGGEGPSSAQRVQNEVLLERLYTGTALSSLAVVSTLTSYPTYEGAIEHRDFLISEIEKFLESSYTGDELYASFQDLLSICVRGIPGPYADTDKISKVTLPNAMPSLVLAYRYYGTDTLEDDLILRNGVQNPAFVPAGDIEVLSGG